MSAPLRSISVDMQGEKRGREDLGYTALLLAGLGALVALGLLGVPVATAILFLFGVAAVGVVLYAVGVIVAGHRQAVARRRRRRAQRAGAPAAPAPVPVPARLRSPA